MHVVLRTLCIDWIIESATIHLTYSAVRDHNPLNTPLCSSVMLLSFKTLDDMKQYIMHMHKRALYYRTRRRSDEEHAHDECTFMHYRSVQPQLAYRVVRDDNPLNTPLCSSVMALLFKTLDDMKQYIMHMHKKKKKIIDWTRRRSDEDTLATNAAPWTIIHRDTQPIHAWYVMSK
jgi:hypothetical protein